MKLRRTLFLLSILLHLLCIYWIAQLKIPFLIPVEVEKIIDVVPVSVGRIYFPGELQSLAGGTGPAGKEALSLDSAPSKPVRGAAGPGKPALAGEGEGAVEVRPPPLTVPAPEAKTIPELSVYSEGMQELLRNFDPRGAGSGGMGSPAGGGGPGSGGPGESEGAAGESRVFFNSANYDLTPWSQRVLLSVQRNWRIPLVTRKKVEQPVEIITLIEKNGKISSLTVKISSNSDAFDLAAVNALRLSSPLPGLPGDFPGKSLEARFMFTYSVQ